MNRIEPCILMNMVMIYDGEGNILVQNRLNPNWPGICFPGGHVEPEESFVLSAIREIKEETGLDITDLELCGIRQWRIPTDPAVFPGGKPTRCIVLLYKTCHFSGELRSSEEGEVFWIKREELFQQKLASNFSYIVEIMESDHLSENYSTGSSGRSGYMQY